MPNFTKNTPGPLKQSIKTPNEPPNGAPHEPPNGSPHEQPNLAPAGAAPAQQGSPPNSATQPGEAAAPANSTASKGGGFGFLSGLIGPKSQAGPKASGFASTAPAAKPAGGTWSMGQMIFSPSFPPTISFQSGGGPASGQFAGPNFGAGKKPGQPGNTDPSKQPNAQPGQPGKTDTNQPPTGQPASQPDKIDSNQPPAGRPGPPAKTDGAPDWWDETMQPPPNQPDATSEDIAHFKSASEGNEGFTEEAELAWIAHLKTSWPKVYGHIPDAELHAVLRYTGDDYDKVNTALRNHDPDPKWGGYARTVNAALAKLPKYKKTVVRGCDLPEAIDQQWQKGAHVSDPGFTSTSAASDTPVAFRKQHEIYIESKTGAYVENLSYYGHHKLDPKKAKYPPDLHSGRESEVLFPSNTRFRVAHREKMEVHEWDKSKTWDNDPPKLVKVVRDVIYLVEE
ncbi:hypothetical protein OV203_33115 [Nannocystis sp. ILAH1]|uniref:ADP-ribosyltransferase n=1 Tax=Nannocystis sp. ILAH1 TaxID=2996789 RepID=UPI00227183A4|nr:hypothetical protein [Nannocystis sp. ILAH1]